MSKKFKCINPKSFNLTEGNEYEVLSSTDTRIQILNDNGLAANYALSLFQEVPDVPELSYKFTILNDTIRLNINRSITPLFIIDTTRVQCSCGVKQLDGISGVPNEIESALAKAHQSYNTPENVQAVTNAAFQFAVSQYTKRNRGGILLASTNTSKNGESFATNAKGIEVLREAFNSLGDVCIAVEANNPNTDNNIILWTIVVHQLKG